MHQHLSVAAVAGSESSTKSPQPQTLAKTNGAQYEILLVEDEPALRDLLTQFLRQNGYTVYGVANGREALQYLEANGARLIITDIFMPDADGLEFLARLRALHALTPIIAMSGGFVGDTKLYLKMASCLGARLTLTKPFPLPELLAGVEETVGPAAGRESTAETSRKRAGESPDRK